MKKIIKCFLSGLGINLFLFSSCLAADTSFDNPIGFSSVSELLSSILDHLMGVVAVVAIVFIIIGGLMYMLSAGNEKMITRAKACWTAAVIGMAIVFAAPTFLKEIKNILGGGSTGTNPDAWVSGALTLQQIAINVLNLLLALIGIIAIVSLVVGGGMYLTAYGDEDRIKKAKNIVTYAIIGIVVSLGSLVIVKQLSYLISAQ